MGYAARLRGNTSSVPLVVEPGGDGMFLATSAAPPAGVYQLEVKIYGDLFVERVGTGVIFL